MIGIIMTGHDQFSTGLKSSLEMIAGAQEHVEVIVFEENVNLDDYKVRMNTCLNCFLEKYEGVLIMTDIPGGTPFNIAVISSEHKENVEIISGTNLPMLIEASLKTQFSHDVHNLADEIINTGKAGIVKFEILEKQCEEIEGGI